jgi:hypothetical protein
VRASLSEQMVYKRFDLFHVVLESLPEQRMFSSSSTHAVSSRETVVTNASNPPSQEGCLRNMPDPTNNYEL